MKKKCIGLCLVLAALMFTCKFQDSDLPVDSNSERNQLEADIAVIESADLENLKEYYSLNKEWIEDLNIRIEKYIATFPKDQRETVLIELRGDNPSTRSISTYFNSCQYHLRGGYWTYSMSPKLSTRLLRPYCAAGWNELAAVYYYIRYDNGSLSNQYWCHFDAFIEANWDIERGRPLVSYIQTCLALCNP